MKELTPDATSQGDALTTLQLGLIGDNIASSKAPLLHCLAGRLAGIEVSYERLVPGDLGLTFDETFARCAAGGYRGINITYPYKELAARKVGIGDPLVRAMGAVNTVVFAADGPQGYNTDYSGFVASYRNVRGAAPAGRVCLIGAGGAGKAVAFGLLRLGLESLAIADLDTAKAAELAARLAAAAPDLAVAVSGDAAEAAADADGLVNCTPVGMVGYEGTPLARENMSGADWAFDAVYTPVDTRFLTGAADEGLTIISGYELFFYQGVDAWQIFSGAPVDQAALRRTLAAEGS